MRGFDIDGYERFPIFLDALIIINWLRYYTVFSIPTLCDYVSIRTGDDYKSELTFVKNPVH
jgi:hypothetical protein